MEKKALKTWVKHHKGLWLRAFWAGFTIGLIVMTASDITLPQPLAILLILLASAAFIFWLVRKKA